MVLPEVTDEWILPHRIRDSHVGQNVSSVVRRVLVRPLLQFHRAAPVFTNARSPNYSVVVAAHPQEINHGESELNDGTERLPGRVSV